jgi:hypothetical protein
LDAWADGSSMRSLSRTSLSVAGVRRPSIIVD